MTDVDQKKESETGLVVYPTAVIPTTITAATTVSSIVPYNPPSQEQLQSNICLNYLNEMAA